MVCWGDFKGSCILLVLWLHFFSLLKDSDFIAIWVNTTVRVLVLVIVLICVMFISDSCFGDMWCDICTCLTSFWHWISKSFHILPQPSKYFQNLHWISVGSVELRLFHQIIFPFFCNSLYSIFLIVEFQDSDLYIHAVTGVYIDDVSCIRFTHIFY
jgi:hypothetical protein